MPPCQTADTQARHALVVADGDVPSRAALDAAWPGWDAGVTDVIAADGGFARALAVGLEPTLLVGDLDSLEPVPRRRRRGRRREILRSPVAKDESDTELALLEAVRRGATRVTVLGAFGGPRLDHELANVWLLGHPALAGVAVALLDARRVRRWSPPPAPTAEPSSGRCRGEWAPRSRLLPFGGDVDGVTTRGLRYPLHDEPLLAGRPAACPTSARRADAAVRCARGRLLVIETAS